MRIRTIFFIMGLLISQIAVSQDQMFDICPLKVGEDIPEVSLVNNDSEQVNLRDMVEEKPAVIIFYRGAWCGYCTKHLAELNDIKEEVEELGYQIFGVTVDQPAKLEESIERSDTEILVYSDSKLEAISAFGLDWKVGTDLLGKYKNKYQLDLEEWSGEDHHSLPVPAVFIVKDKTVAFQYVNPNYKSRLKPETLLAVLKTL